jgi:DNA repair exonuclease SbcCD ATPase subunit
MGLTLISGDNGAGKSTLRQAIEYLLLDKTSDSIPVDELHRDGDKPCMLQAELEMENGDEVRIVKYRNDPVEKNKTYLYINGDDSLTATDRRITQNSIEQLLNITPDLLFSSTLFSAHSPSFVECAEKDRKEILYNFIDREKYDKLLHKTKDCVDECDNLINNINLSQNNVQQQIFDAKEHLEKLDVAEKEYVEEAKAEIVLLLKSRDRIKEEDTTELEEHMEQIRSQIKEPNESRLRRIEEKDRLVNKKRKELEKDYYSYQAKIESVESCVCPILATDCNYLDEYKEELEDQYLPLMEKVVAEIKDLDNKSRDLISRSEVLIKEIEVTEELCRKYDALERELDSKIKYNSKLSKSIEDLDRQIKSKSESLKDNKFTKLKKETEDKLENLRIDRDKLEKDREWLQIDKQYYEYWVTGFSRAGIPNMKMEGILASLEEETNNYLSRVSDNIYVEIDAQTELKSADVKEKISYKVHHPDKAIKNYNSYSGGERQRVKLSDIFAFNTLLGKFDIMILDEVLEGSIDDKGKSLVISLLREKSSELGSMFVISHDDYIKDSFDNVMWVKKTNGISKIRG